MEENRLGEQAIPLITIEEGSSEFKVNPQAVAYLQSVPKPISVVGVAGMYRTGKSYLLNRVILNKNEGFGVSPTTNACTKGIWVWSKPLQGRAENGESVNVIVIDSEGIGALDETQDHDNRIFSLVILLSSCFIYNSVGTIDETAIENLNLIVNITKNIHVQASDGSDEPSEEDYQKYFPSFLWVVRDFALQLVDEDGDSITPKQYLENALRPQEGFSEAIENKNYVREILRSFFGTRDCALLIKPIVDEEKLQSMSGMPIEELRPEFVEQIFELRKNLLNTLRCKQINGEHLSGGMLAALLGKWITAVNQGAVPNIENAWTYMCREQCKQAFDACYQEFYEGIDEMLGEDNFPNTEHYLATLYENMSENAVAKFKDMAVGETADQKLAELKSRMEDYQTQLLLDNTRSFHDKLVQNMELQYQQIERNLESGNITSYDKYQRAMKSFRETFVNLLEGPNKDLLIERFVNAKTNEAIALILKFVEKENDEQLEVLRKVKGKMEVELAGHKEEIEVVSSKMETSVNQLESDKRELAVKLTAMESALEEIKSSAAVHESRVRTELTDEIYMLQEKIQDLEKENMKFSDCAKEYERKATLLRSEFARDKALLEQKLKFFEETQDSQSKKEKTQQKQVKVIEELHRTEIREISDKFQSTIIEQTETIKIYEDRLTTMEEELQEAKEKEGKTSQNSKTLEVMLKGQLEEAQAQIESLTEKTEQLHNKSMLNIEASTAGPSSEETSELQERIEGLERQLSAKNKELESKGKDIERERAIHKQNIQHQETHLQNLRNELDNAKMIHEKSINAFNGQNAKRTDVSKQLQDLQDSHSIQIKQIEEELKETRARLLYDADLMHNEKVKQLEEVLLERNSFEDELAKVKAQLKTASAERAKLAKEAQEFEEEKQSLLTEIQAHSTRRITALQNELMMLKDQNETEIDDLNMTHQEQMAKLRQLFESEKEKLQAIISDAKDKYDRKLKEATDDLEAKLKTQKDDYEETIEQYQEDLENSMINLNNTTRMCNQEIELRQNKINELEEQKKNLKAKLDALESQHKDSFQNSMAALIEERKHLSQKLEETKDLLTKAEKELIVTKSSAEAAVSERFNLEKKLERQEKTNKMKIDDLEMLKADLTEKNSRINQEFTQMQIDYSTEGALSKQKLDHKEKIIEGLELKLEEAQNASSERLHTITTEHRKEVTRFETEIKSQREELTSKIEDRRKNMRETEKGLQSELELHRKRADGLEEANSKMSGELEKLRKKGTDELQGLTAMVAELKQRLSDQKTEYTADTHAKMEKIKELELEITAISGKAQTEYELLKNEHQFQIEQKDNLSKQLEEHRSRFEKLMLNFNSFQSKEQDEESRQQRAIMETTEKRYHVKIQEVEERAMREKEELSSKIHKLEIELGELQKQYKIEITNKNNANVAELEERVSQLEVSEASLQETLKRVKKEKDRLILEYSQAQEESSAQFMAQIKILKKKVKEIQNRRNEESFQNEKEKTSLKSKIERYQSNLGEKEDRIKELEKKFEVKMRELEQTNNKMNQYKRLARPQGRNFNNLASGIVYNNSINQFERSFIGRDNDRQSGGFQDRSMNHLPSEKSDKENDLPLGGKYKILDDLATAKVSSTPIKKALTHRKEGGAGSSFTGEKSLSPELLKDAGEPLQDAQLTNQPFKQFA